MPDYPPTIAVQPLPGPFDVSLRLPGSKSLTNRALLLAALGRGESIIRRPLEADDTARMLESLRALGVKVRREDDAVHVTGCGGRFPAKQATLMCGNSGTTIRSLAAAVCLAEGAYVLDGVPRMRERPIGELVEPLRELGAQIDYLGTAGFPPLKVNASGLRGGQITMKPTLSSQYISALLMAGPLMKHGLDVTFEGAITSGPYVMMTCLIMDRFGAAFDGHPWSQFEHRITVPRSGYSGCEFTVEPDASSASYFLAAAAAVPGARVRIADLHQDSPQGDARFAEHLYTMGASVKWHESAIEVAYKSPLRGIDADLGDMPDAAMTLATLAVLAQGPTTIRGVGNWRVKETDRMAAMQTELAKLGATVAVEGGDITITPPATGRITPAAIDTYDDHRMAMSFAVIGLVQPGVTINDPACVAKTFPTFFDELDRLRQTTGAAT